MADISKIQIENATYDIKDEIGRNHSQITFDNVASLKASTLLKNGNFVKTMGYYSIDDGGSALYYIRTITNADTPNDKDIITITNDNTIVAQYINDKKRVNPLVFGAKGDGTTDDTTALQFTFDYARDNELEVYIPTPSSFYKITSGLTVEGGVCGIICEKYDYSGIIRGYGSNYTMLTIEDILGFYCKNLSLGGNNRNEINGILHQGHVGLNIFEHIRVYDIAGYGLKLNAIWDSVFTDISIEKCGSASEYAFSMNNDGDTCNMTNVNRLQVEQAYEKAIFIDGGTLSCVITNIHSERLNYTNDSNYAWSLSGSSCIYDGVRLQAANNDGDIKNLIYIGGDACTYNDLRFDSHLNATCDSQRIIRITNSALYSASEKTDQIGVIYFNSVTANTMNISSFTIIEQSDITNCITAWSIDDYKTKIINSTIGTLNSTSTHNHYYLDGCKVSKLLTDSVRKAIVKNSTVGEFIKLDGTTHDKIAYSNFEIYNSTLNTNIGIDGSEVIIHDSKINGNFYHQFGNNPYSFVNNVISGTVTGYNSAPSTTPVKLTKTDNLQPNASSPRGWIYNGSTWIEY